MPFGVAGKAVAPGGFEPGMAGEFGDENDVVAGADGTGQEGVEQGLGRLGHVCSLAEAAGGEVDRSGAEPLSFKRPNEGRSVALEQRDALCEPSIERVTDLAVTWDLAVAVALAAAHLTTPLRALMAPSARSSVASSSMSASHLGAGAGLHFTDMLDER